MSTDYLYNKYRPQEFKDMVGNKPIFEALSKTLDNDTVKPGYLFTGRKGTGKSTSADILARELCAEPITVNCADNTGIDYYKTLFHTLQQGTFGNVTRVIIMEEIHKISNSASNFLLVELEHSPKDCHFIATSSEVTKLLPAMKSRLVHYNFTAPTTPEIMGLLSSIVEMESKNISRKVLGHIASLTSNHPRDAISTLEALIDIVDEKDQLVTLNATGAIKDAQRDLFQAILYKKSWNVIVPLIKAACDNNAEEIRMSCTAYMGSVLLGSNSSVHEQAANIIHIMKIPYSDSRSCNLTLSCYMAILK